MATENTRATKTQATKTQTQAHDGTPGNTEVEKQSGGRSTAAAAAPAHGSRGPRASRRRVLGSATKAAVATLAAGALVVEGATRAGGAPTAHANGSEGPTVFTATGTTTAVTAFAQNADAVYGQTSDTTNASAGVEGVAPNGLTYGVRGQNTGGGTGIIGLAPNGYGVVGDSRNNSATDTGTGVTGTSNQGFGVVGTSTGSNGVVGQSGGAGGCGVVGYNYFGTAILGDATHSGSGAGAGVQGKSDTGVGVAGNSTSGYGVEGVSGSAAGVAGISTASDGVYGSSGNLSAYGVHGQNTGGGTGVVGFAPNGKGVVGDSRSYGNVDTGYGVYGTSDYGYAVYGTSDHYGYGVYGKSINGDAVYGNSPSGNGVVGYTGGTGNGVTGTSVGGDGVFGNSVAAGAYAVHGVNPAGTAILGDATNSGTGSGTGAQGKSDTGYGLEALSGGTALHAKSSGANGVAAKLEGLLQVLGGAVGEATLAAGASSVTVPSTAVTASSLILLMPLGNPQGFLWVGNIAAGASFTINLAHGPSLGIASRQVLATPLTMRYLIIN